MREQLTVIGTFVCKRADSLRLFSFFKVQQLSKVSYLLALLCFVPLKIFFFPCIFSASVLHYKVEGV